jgi:hypothetical protein
MSILKITNSQGEENLEINTLHSIVCITTRNVYDGKVYESFCELNNEQVQTIIETLQELIKK